MNHVNEPETTARGSVRAATARDLVDVARVADTIRSIRVRLYTPGGETSAASAYSATLPRTDTSVARARRLVSASLRVWSLEAGDGKACLVISELVTNAVRHARLEVMHVKVSRVGPRRVRVAVVDLSRTMPRLVNAGVDDESGRGLATVAGFSAAWGVDPVPWGKRVWAELDVPGGDS